MKNCSHNIGNQAHELAVCSTVPQPTACSVSCRPNFRNVHRIVKSDFKLQLVFTLGTKFYAYINPLAPNHNYSGRTAPLTSKHCILYIY